MLSRRLLHCGGTQASISENGPTCVQHGTHWELGVVEGASVISLARVGPNDQSHSSE